MLLTVRTEPERFAEEQSQLVQTFADSSCSDDPRTVEAGPIRHVL